MLGKGGQERQAIPDPIDIIYHKDSNFLGKDAPLAFPSFLWKDWPIQESHALIAAEPNM